MAMLYIAFKAINDTTSPASLVPNLIDFSFHLCIIMDVPISTS